ncbi:MAG: M16 family metallopeptidase [Mycobacteriales bacterium]
MSDGPGAAGASSVRRTRLPNGVRVVTEQVPGVRSVSYGLFVGVGSQHENRRQAGASHYLEHMLFKGTPRRDALAISAAFDRVGGELNAYTSKDYTCFYARVLDSDLPLAVDAITDMVFASTLARTDVEAERGVILEEIAMHDDEPADAVHDVFAGTLYGDAPLGRPILGSEASIGAISRDTIAGYWRRGYTPDRTVVAISGNLDHRAALRLVRKAFRDYAPSGSAAGLPTPKATRLRTGHVRVRERRSGQVNLVLGTPALARGDDRRYALSVLNAALGGGMSSRLFQEVREKRGLAYSVYSFTSSYTDAGHFGVYVGCAPRRTAQVLDICRSELAHVAAHGLSGEEMDLGKGQVRGGLVLGLEDTGARMTRLGKSELVYGELPTVAEVLRRIEAVTPDEVRAVASDVLGARPSLALLGPVPTGVDLEGLVA